MTAVILERTGIVEGLQPLLMKGQYEQGFYYTGLGVDENILEHTAIPKENSAQLRFKVPFYASGYRVEEYTNTSGRVGVLYTTGSEKVTTLATYIKWEMTYKKTPLKIPTFVVRASYFTPANSTEVKKLFTWEEQGWEVGVEYSCLTVTVNRISKGLTVRSEILRDMAIAEEQRGHVHILPAFPNKFWVMQPAVFSQVDPYRVAVTYVWLSDPGNGPMALPAAVPKAKRDLCHYPRAARPPWHGYQVIPSQDIIQDAKDIQTFRPEILNLNLFPEQSDEGGSNPFYTPDGWRKLPGRPFQ